MNLAGVVSPLITGILLGAAGQNEILGFNYTLICCDSLLFIFGGLFFAFANHD